jgi:hypothetical protein
VWRKVSAAYRLPLWHDEERDDGVLQISKEALRQRVRSAGTAGTGEADALARGLQEMVTDARRRRHGSGCDAGAQMGGSLGENENRPGAVAMEQEKEAAVAWEPWMEDDETKLSDEKRQVGLLRRAATAAAAAACADEEVATPQLLAVFRRKERTQQETRRQRFRTAVSSLKKLQIQINDVGRTFRRSLVSSARARRGGLTVQGARAGPSAPRAHQPRHVHPRGGNARCADLDCD